MKQSVFLSICALMGTLHPDSVEGRRPNVVIFYTDDQPTDSFGFIRGKAHTPNIDRLAKEGTYFSNAYATSSVCSPSRYSALTGQYASRCPTKEFSRSTSAEGVTKVLWNMGIADDQWNFPRVMRQNGYKTGMVGKWHVGLNGKFGHRKEVPGTDPADPAVKEVLRFNQELYCKDIAENGFDYVGAAYAGNPDDDKNLVKTGCNVHAPEWQTQHALEFIEKYKDEPFVLYFATTLLHVPDCTGDLQKDPRLTPLGLLDEPIAGVLPPREDVIRRAKAAGVEEGRLGKLIAATWLDDVVGTVQGKLKELGLDDHTLILYFNDNNTDDHGKGSCYQGGAHVPMMAYLPGVVKPGERKELVANIDIAPTLFDWCGVVPPKDMQMDGASLMPLLRGEKVADWRGMIYLEIGLTRAVVTDDGFKYLAFRVPESYTARPLEERMEEHRKCMEEIYRRHPWTKGKWTLDPEAKYLQMGMAPGGDAMERFQLMDHPPFEQHYFDPDQLFDLNRDPRETTNLANNPEYRAKLEQMQKKLESLLADVPGTFADLKPEE